MFRNKSVSTHQFAMVPRADIPRSVFIREFAHKTTFDAGFLIPFYVDEVLPGDSFKLRMTAFARLTTPLFPIMDNLHLDTQFFFVPNRLIWNNWEKFNGEQDNPGDSTSFVIPQVVSPVGGWPVNSIGDYFGLPTVGTTFGGAATVSVNALPFRAYNLIFNEWYRDQNMQNSLTVLKTDGPDPNTNYSIARRGKRHDYFTSCLPWPQKGNAVTLPLGTSAPVKTQSTEHTTGAQSALTWRDTAGTVPTANFSTMIGPSGGLYRSTTAATTSGNALAPTNLIADLSTATAATINAIRLAFQMQKLLERDARGGTRYTEIVRSHFGVISPDARLQRPEYLGGGSTVINISPIAQTSATGVTGGSTPVATLAAIGTAVASGHGFNTSFTEHGYVMGIMSVRADLTYQQGLRKMWSRSTRFDFYWPVFSGLGEQAVLNKEIYCTGTPAQDDAVFGYQERYGEYRYFPSMITGLFRSTSAGTLDPWHLAQNFTSLPALNTTFIAETPPLSRILAVGAAANGKQLLFDSVITIRSARPMPMFGVPGLIDHF